MIAHINNLLEIYVFSPLDQFGDDECSVGLLDNMLTDLIPGIRYIEDLSYFVLIPTATAPFIILIAFVSYVSRAVSLGTRVFANVFAGHSLVKILANFAWLFGFAKVTAFTRRSSTALILLSTVSKPDELSFTVFKWCSYIGIVFCIVIVCIDEKYLTADSLRSFVYDLLNLLRSDGFLLFIIIVLLSVEFVVVLAQIHNTSNAGWLIEPLRPILSPLADIYGYFQDWYNEYCYKQLQEKHPWLKKMPPANPPKP